LHLTKPEDYAILSSSGCTEIEHVDDTAEFNHVVKSFGVLGLSAEEQNSIFSVLAGLLHLCNVKFIAHETVADTALIDPATSDAQNKAAKLFGYSSTAFPPSTLSDPAFVAVWMSTSSRKRCSAV